MFHGNKFISGTHTFPLVLYNVCDSPNRQNTRHFNMPSFLSRCEWFFNMRQSSVPITQIHPFETGCMFSIGPHLSPYVPLPCLCGNDTRCHCKKRQVEVLSCTPIKQTYSVPRSCNMCTVRTKTSNVPGIVISQTDNGPSSLQAKYCH